MVYVEQTPPALQGPWLGSSLAEISTVEGWIGAAKLRPLVQRTPRCRLPMGMTVSPGWPEVWVVHLPSAEAVRRTALAREGRATETHWARLSGGLPARSRGFPLTTLPCLRSFLPYFPHLSLCCPTFFSSHLWSPHPLGVSRSIHCVDVNPPSSVPSWAWGKGGGQP